MAGPNLATPVWQAFAKIGVAVGTADQAAFEKVLEPLADSDANTIVTSIADHIKMHGLAGLENQPLRNALIGAEPTIDAVINNNIDGGYNTVLSALRRAAGLPAAT